MVTPLIATKLFLPLLRSDRVARLRLLERLDAGLRRGRRLTLVSAPAGYGKTSLVSEWVRASILEPAAGSVAWLSLDAGDNDPAQFLRYLIAALQGADAAIGRSALSLLDAPQPPELVRLLALLVNEMVAAQQSILLVLDDYHAITIPSIHAMLEFLLEHQPANLHIVLLTRSDPSLPFARLRARGQLTELRAADLRFSVEETAAFFAGLGLRLQPEDIASLESRVEGWAAGVQLVALALQSLPSSLPEAAFHPDPQSAEVADFIRAFTGSHHFVIEYLVEEVLLRQPAAIQDFLLRTALLNRLCAPLCDAVLESNASQQALDHLERNNVFLMPLDHTHHWYRYHALFADVLSDSLRARLPAGDIAGLHRRASLWYWQNGALEEAVEHAFAAQDFDQVADILETAAKSTMLHGDLRALLRWTDRIPHDWLRSRLRLWIYRGWAMFLNGQSDRAGQLLRAARADLLSRPASDDLRALRGELASMLALVSTTDQPADVLQDIAQEALDYLPETDRVSRARATRVFAIACGYQGDTGRSLRLYQQACDLARTTGSVFLVSSVLESIASTHTHHGRLRQAAQVYQELVDLGGLPGQAPLPFVGNGYMGLAEIRLEQDDLEDAARYLQLGMDLIQRGGIGYNLVPAWCIQARLKLALADAPGALEALRLAGQASEASHSPPSMVYLASHQVLFWLAQGDTHQAGQWALGPHLPGVREDELEALPIVVREVYCVSQASVFLALGDYDRVLEIAGWLMPQATEAGRLGRTIEMGLLQAAALHAQGNLSAASAGLASVLDLAQPEGYIRLFVETGAPARALVEDTRPALRGMHRAYAEDLLAAFVRQDQRSLANRPPAAPFLAQALPLSLTSTPSSATAPLTEPLTAREQEVLRLLVAGYSNQEIATQLVVSLNTVKKHTSNLFAKLGVISRTQATARARDLGLT